MIRQAIEGQIGMLTCQLIDVNIRLQMAQAELGKMVDELHRKETEIKALAELLADKDGKS